LANLKDRKRLRMMEVQMRDVEQRCELLLDSSKDAIAYINDGMHIYANGSYLSFLGYDDIDEMICIPVLDTLDTASQEKFKELSKNFFDRDEAEPVEGVSMTSVREDGTEITVQMSLSEASYDGERCLQIVLRPEEDNAELQEKLKQMSQMDLLTGLYNRQYYMEQLHHAKEAALKDKTQYAVLYMAIDDFQQIKADLGIADADLILRDLASELETNTKEDWTLARLSDDIFGIIAPAESGDDALAIGEVYRNKVEDHLFEVEGRTLQITLSVGATLITDNAPNIKDILGRAQIASEEIKTLEGHEKGNGVQLYRPKNLSPLEDHDIASQLIEDALENNKFKLLFQPIIALRGESEEHYEAFVRMIDDKGEEVSPYDFLPPSGPSNMASKIDKWVILQTVKQLSEHRSKGHDTKLFINLTAETIQDKDFSSWLNVALKAARLPGDSLIFQISESNAITYLKQAKEFSKGIKTLHCRLSVNQFGLALNPFNLLKHLDPEYIKLEGSFTQDMQKGDEAKENAKEMIQNLQAQEKLTIVPLVESAALLSTLWQAGVNYIQGYYLQAPTTEMNYDFSEE
ncbi:MAG: EAL domain-containing protein, partial [Oleiphilaceae bacterium]|nr:EAL domain-containing protein [Oleiphilaceae bacterium]